MLVFIEDLIRARALKNRKKMNLHYKRSNKNSEKVKKNRKNVFLHSKPFYTIFRKKRENAYLCSKNHEKFKKMKKLSKKKLLLSSTAQLLFFPGLMRKKCLFFFYFHFFLKYAYWKKSEFSKTH